MQKILPKLTSIIFTIILGTSSIATALETEFLSDGGIRYTYGLGDWGAYTYADSTGFKFYDVNTNWFHDQMCIINDSPSLPDPGSANWLKSMRSTYERMNQSIETSNWNNLIDKSSDYWSNLTYYTRNTNSYQLTSQHADAAYASGPGEVRIRIRYSAKGNYLSVKGHEQQAVYDSMPIFIAWAQEGFGDEIVWHRFNGATTVGNIHKEPIANAGNWQWKRINVVENWTNSISIRVNDEAYFSLHISNKICGVGLKIELMEIEFHPDSK